MPTHKNYSLEEINRLVGFDLRSTTFIGAELMNKFSKADQTMFQDLIKKGKLSSEMKKFGTLPNAVPDGLMEGLCQRQYNLRSLFKVTPEMCESIYAQAHHMYTQGQYEDAIVLFRLLTMLEGASFRYLFGLAACYHMQQAYREASEAYLLALALDLSNPMPGFHAADCYMQLEDYGAAMTCLGYVIYNPDVKDPKYNGVKEKSTLLYQVLTDKVAQQIIDGEK